MVSIIHTVCLFALFFFNAHGEVDETEAVNETDAEEYLAKYGYLDGLGKRSGNPQQRQIARTNAVRSFQEFAGLPVTGKLDEATKRQMLAPRCGMTDSRTRAGVSRWNKNQITWALGQGTSQLDSGRVRRAIQQSLDIWAQQIPLNFTEVHQQSKPNMLFSFGSRDHGDGNSFDGPSGVLAHAFYPEDGRLHFDDEERWAFEDGTKISQGYIDLLSVTIHELGHSLGLPHTNDPGAIMNPFYRSPDFDSKGQMIPFKLSQYDIRDIQAIYGPRQGGNQPATPQPTPQPTPPVGPSGGSCPRFQAVVTGMDGATYFISGNSGWKKANAANGAPNSATRFYVDKMFPGAPSNGITAAVTDRLLQLTFLFQGRRVYAYTWTSGTGQYTLAAGYPKDLPGSITPQGAFQLKESQVVLYQNNDFMIWDAYWNTATFTYNNIQAYFANIPTGLPSFAVGDDKFYFVSPTDYTVYDERARAVTGTKPLNTLITC